MGGCARRSTPGFVFYGLFLAVIRLRESRSSGRRTPQRELGPLRESGSTIFDNSKAGKFTPRTLGRLRSAWGNEGVDYYKFCSSMLSSTVDLQGELSQAPANVESIAAEARNRAAEEWSYGKQGGRASGKPRNSHRGEFQSAQVI